MFARNLFLGFSSLFLIAAIPIAVYLVSQQQTLRSKAFSPLVTPQLSINGENVIDHRAVKPQISLVINYPQTALQPDEFRISNTITGLEQAKTIPYTGNGQTVPWSLDELSPTPSVYLQLRINNQWQTPIFASIPLNETKK